MSVQKGNLWVKILLGSAAFVVSTWVSAYFSIQGVNAQSFGFGTVTASTASWYKTTETSDIYYKDGNVGIGTEVPSNRLDVEGSLAVGAAYSGATTAPENSLIVEGKVGIGTQTPSVSLEIASTAPRIILRDSVNSSENLATGYIEVKRADNTRIGWVGDGSDGSDNMAVYADGGGVSIGNSSGYVYVAPNGNVGIGITSPATKLDVNGQISGGFGAVTTAGTLNWNDATNARSGSGYSLLFGDASNGPGPHIYFHPFSFEYNSKDGTGSITQLAIPYVVSGDGSMYMRSRYSGTWTAWSKIISTDASGNVGIGTITPATKLDVNGQISGGFGAVTTGGTLDWNNASNARSGNGYTLLKGNASNGPGPDIYFHPLSFEYSSKDGTGNMTQFAIPYAVSGDGSMYMRSRYSGTWTAWSKIISTDANGKVGIGMTATEKLHVNGAIAATSWVGAGCEGGCDTASNGYAIMYADGHVVTSGAIFAGGAVYSIGIQLTSDQSLKKDIEPLKNALDKILKLQGATYHWKDEKKDPNLQIGFIAQEVEQVLPELVNTSEKDGLKSLNYIGVIPVLTEAVKEQQKQIESQAAAIEDLQNQLNILKDAQK